MSEWIVTHAEPPGHAGSAAIEGASLAPPRARRRKLEGCLFKPLES